MVQDRVSRVEGLRRLLPPPGGRLARAGAIAAVSLVAALSLMPHLSVPDAAPQNTDLLIHLVMQGTLGFGMLYGWPRQLFWTLTGLAFLVAGLEIGQIWVPGRSFAWSDLITNGIGAGLGAVLGRYLAK